MNLHTEYPANLRLRYAMTATIAMTLWFGSGVFAPTAHAAGMGDADDKAMVDCMLPGELRRLSNNVTIMGARHPVRTTRADCHVRGGEYHEVDGTSVLGGAVSADVPPPSAARPGHRTARIHHRTKTHHMAKTVTSTSTK